MKKKPATRKAHKFPPRKTPAHWHLVAIDQEPIRKRAASECSKAMTQLENAKGEWRRFEREDRPAYERWMSATFGALLTKIRETEALIEKQEGIIDDVETECMFGGGSPAAAYKRIMREREFPSEQTSESGNSGKNGATGDGGASDPDDPDFDPFGFDNDPELVRDEMLFDQYVRIMLGLDPDRMGDAQYDRMFKDFRRKVAGMGKKGGSPPPPPKGSATHQVKSAPVKPEAIRIKEIYRLLVRRLHPDLRADKDAEVSHFWHEVQEAYEHGNLERLEMLLALTDLQSNALGDHTSLFQMRSVLSELRKAFRALQKSLGLAKKDPAWNFARVTNRLPAKAGIQRKLDAELAKNEAYLAQLNAHIAVWEAAAKKTKTHPARTPPPQPFGFSSSKKKARPRGARPRYEQTGFGF